MQGGRRKTQVAFLHAMNPAVGATRELRLIPPECSVGSEESNDVVIRDGSVSRRHARFRQRRRKWQVIDCGSTNGTYLADRRVVAWTTLRDGQEVRLGGARFVFRSSYAPTARGTNDLSVLARASRLRTAFLVVVAGLLVGFAAAQYFLYRSYEHQLALSKPLSERTIRQPSRAPISPESTSRVPAERAPTPPWLERVNYWRNLADLSSVSGAPELSAAAEKHARYLVKHALKGELEQLAAGGAHTEDPEDPWYTPSGLAAAQNGDVTPPCKGCPLLSAAQRIDDFVAVPFHRLPILDPEVRKIGFGSYTEGGLQAALLYLPIPPAGSTKFSKPIEFPPNGSTVSLAAYQSEWPDPLASCPGYGTPAGVPITLTLGRWLLADVSTYAVKAGDKTLESCVFNASTYSNPNGAAQTRARDILKAYGTVVLIPRQPLASGQTYTISIRTNDQNYNWSFRVE